jgi:tRNA(fMet)-specific endonuclease VapC
VTRLLDTDTCIGILRQRPGFIQRLSQFTPNDCGISTVTVYELYSGLAGAKDPNNERLKIQKFVSAIVQLPFDHSAAEHAANTRAQLTLQGAIIGPYDLLIAGHALASGLILVTGNVREFQRVPGLVLETWP